MRQIISEGFWCIELNPERWQDWEEFDWDFLVDVTEYCHVDTIMLSRGHHILVTAYEATATNLDKLEDIKEQIIELFGDDAILNDDDDEESPEAGQ